MDDWTAGYLTDVNYTYGVTRELTPSLLAFASLAAGIVAPDVNGPLTYCELGCGQGYATNLLAAANPHIEFYATDFNPAHIAGARSFAAAAGIGNIQFRDNSFDELAAAQDLPDFDIIALQGIYSWVSAENRRHIVEILRKRLKPGGLVYVSYNTLPGWASLMPLRRLMADSIAATTGAPLVRLDQAMAQTQQLMDVGAAYFHVTLVEQTFRGMNGLNRSYLAHEYFNPNAAPSYFADMAAEMRTAKLTYAGSAHMLDKIDGIHFTAEQSAFLESVTDPVQREAMRDYILNQVFRRDIFVKGAVPLAPEEVREQWLKSRFVMTSDRKDISFTVRGGLGDAALQPEVYTPLLDALAGGPTTTLQLLDDPQIAALGWARITQALMVLVGMGHVQPALDQAGDAARAASVKDFNLAVIEKAKWSKDFEFLASPITGGPIGLDRLSQLFLLAQHEGHRDAADFVWDVLSGTGTHISKGDKPLETAEESLAELRPMFDDFTRRRHPILASTGIRPPPVTQVSWSAAE
jgi:SAM-dependent methyltransferase